MTWGCHLLFMGLLHIPHLSLNILERTSQAQGHSSPTRHSFPSSGHRAPHEVASPRCELLDAATCRPFLLRTSTRVLRSKAAKPASSSVLHMRPPLLDMCHHHPRPTGPPCIPEPHSTRTSAILTQSTQSLSCSLALVDVLGVSHHDWSPCLLVCQSKPHIRPSPLRVHRHDTSLLDLHLVVDHHLRAPQPHTTNQETCRTTQLTPKVSHQLNLGRGSRRQ